MVIDASELLLFSVIGYLGTIEVDYDDIGNFSWKCVNFLDEL